MKRANKYSDELKEKIIRECQEVGNVAVVARRHEISPNTIHTWIKKYSVNSHINSDAIIKLKPPHITPSALDFADYRGKKFNDSHFRLVYAKSRQNPEIPAAKQKQMTVAG